MYFTMGLLPSIMLQNLGTGDVGFAPRRAAAQPSIELGVYRKWIIHSMLPNSDPRNLGFEQPADPV
jgi:hypothetical protein